MERFRETWLNLTLKRIANRRLSRGKSMLTLKSTCLSNVTKRKRLLWSEICPPSPKHELCKQCQSVIRLIINRGQRGTLSAWGHYWHWRRERELRRRRRRRINVTQWFAIKLIYNGEEEAEQRRLLHLHRFTPKYCRQKHKRQLGFLLSGFSHHIVRLQTEASAWWKVSMQPFHISHEHLSQNKNNNVQYLQVPTFSLWFLNSMKFGHTNWSFCNLCLNLIK